MSKRELQSVDAWRQTKYADQDSTLPPGHRVGGGEVNAEYFNVSFAKLCAVMKDTHNRPDSVGMQAGSALWLRPPCWVTYKNVAIDGKLLTPAQLRDEKLWDRKYRKELYIGQIINDAKLQKQDEAKYDIGGYALKFRRYIGLDPPLIETAETAEAIAVRALAMEREQEKMDQDDSPTLAWTRFVSAVESGKPLATAGREQYRRSRIDFYGVDQFLDSPVSLAWLNTKLGACFGMIQGFMRSIKIVTVDAQYLYASGIGIMSILNVSILAAGMKWAGNMCGASLAFCAGDQLVSGVKYAVLDPKDARGRSLSNYTVGMACAFACTGILPWWVLNDSRLAARYAISGAFVGSFVGLLTAVTLERMIAANLAVLHATPRELRRFEALMARERFKYLSDTDYSKAAMPHMV